MTAEERAERAEAQLASLHDRRRFEEDIKTHFDVKLDAMEKRLDARIDHKLDKVLFDAKFRPVQAIAFGLIGAMGTITVGFIVSGGFG